MTLAKDLLSLVIFMYQRMDLLLVFNLLIMTILLIYQSELGGRSRWKFLA